MKAAKCDRAAGACVAPRRLCLWDAVTRRDAPRRLTMPEPPAVPRALFLQRRGAEDVKGNSWRQRRGRANDEGSKGSLRCHLPRQGHAPPRQALRAVTPAGRHGLATAWPQPLRPFPHTSFSGPSHHGATLPPTAARWRPLRSNPSHPPPLPFCSADEDVDSEHAPPRATPPPRQPAVHPGALGSRAAEAGGVPLPRALSD